MNRFIKYIRGKKAVTSIAMLLASVMAVMTGCGSTTTGSGSSGNVKYPTKPITVYIPHAAGGSTDIIARALQPYLQKTIGGTIVIQNVEGGGGNQSYEQLYKAKPDGYTLEVAPFPSAILGEMVKDASFKSMDFTFVSQIVGNDFNGIFVRYDSPYKDLKSLLDDAKTKKITMAGSGVGTNSDMARALAEKASGVKFDYVPFDGGTQAAIAVAGGQTVCGFGNMVALKQLQDQKKIRILAAFGAQRQPNFPDVPTAGEAGLQNAAMDVNVGIIGPPNMPADIVKKINDAVQKATSDPDFVNKAKKIGSYVSFENSSDFKTVVQKIYDQASSVKDDMRAASQNKK